MLEERVGLIGKMGLIGKVCLIAQVTGLLEMNIVVVKGKAC